jgi:hypothetical protein
MSPLTGRALELRYEDFLSEPKVALKEMATFCELSASEATIEQVATLVKRERAYAYRRDPALRAFADRVAPRLVAQSY